MEECGSSFYDIGVDPGARNTAIAASDDAVFQPAALDLGPMRTTSDEMAIHVLLESVGWIFSDPKLRYVIIEACEVGPWTEKDGKKDPRVVARTYLVQGALQTLAHQWSKELILVRPAVWKRVMNDGAWSAMSYEDNKRWSVSRAAELFGEAYRTRIHHVADAKLISNYMIKKASSS
jgi:hypothetical protein